MNLRSRKSTNKFKFYYRGCLYHFIEWNVLTLNIQDE